MARGHDVDRCLSGLFNLAVLEKVASLIATTVREFRINVGYNRLSLKCSGRTLWSFRGVPALLPDQSGVDTEMPD